MDLRQFSWLTFDCYGTLIDWESGIVDTLLPILKIHGVAVSEKRLLELYARLETEAETKPYQPYRAVLQNVADALFAHFKIAQSDTTRNCLVNSLPQWPPFADSTDALQRLKKRFKLAILSNTDNDFIDGSIKLLGTQFDAVITAQQVRSYKPALAHFEAALQLPGASNQMILHVAQSLYHDIAPANALKLTTVWVNRRHGREGSGATPPAETQCSLEIRDLKTLADLADR